MGGVPTVMIYYNDNDKNLVWWLTHLWVNQLIPAGVVDDRSIEEIKPEDIREYHQCHFFAGIGGWARALELAGWPADRPVWTGSCPCFPEGTLVITNVGYTPIEQIRVGDFVLTHKNRFKKVTHTGSGLSECISVYGQGHFGLICTPNHPFYTQYGRNWVRADHMKGLRWATVTNIPKVPMPKIPQPKLGYFYDKSIKRYRVRGSKDNHTISIGTFKTECDAKEARRQAIQNNRVAVLGADGVDQYSLGFARFLGYWLGDGWVTSDTVTLCGAKSDISLLDVIFSEAGLHGSAYVEKTSSRIRCGSKSLSAWLTANFGKYAHTKRIPVWLHSMPAEFIRAFLSGYLEADGHTESRKSGNIQCFTTTSRQLAIGVRVLLNQLNVSASLRKVTTSATTVINGRVVNQRHYFKITAYPKSRSFKFGGNHGWGLVRKVEQEGGVSRVYNISVEDDESYTADGIVVHNCQPFSIAGKGKGTSDKRHLWPIWYELIKECRPPTIFGEQVASPLGRDWLDGVRADLEAISYRFGAADICAAAVGAPHIRQRLFWGANLAETRE